MSDRNGEGLQGHHTRDGRCQAEPTSQVRMHETSAFVITEEPRESGWPEVSLLEGLQGQGGWESVVPVSVVFGLCPLVWCHHRR